MTTRARTTKRTKRSTPRRQRWPKITVAWLRNHGACTSRVKQFKRLWPCGADVTKQNIERAYENGMPVMWLTQYLRPRLKHARLRQRCIICNYVTRHGSAAAVVHFLHLK